MEYQVVKYGSKNAIYCKSSCTYEYIGKSKKELEAICKRLNEADSEKREFDLFYE